MPLSVYLVHLRGFNDSVYYLAHPDLVHFIETEVSSINDEGDTISEEVVQAQNSLGKMGLKLKGNELIYAAHTAYVDILINNSYTPELIDIMKYVSEGKIKIIDEIEESLG